MDTDQVQKCRRALLGRTAALVCSLAGIPVIAAAARAAENAKADKALLRYQDVPRNGKTCAGCWAYVPPRRASAPACKAVEGPVSPNGWCMAYSPRRKP